MRNVVIAVIYEALAIDSLHYQPKTNRLKRNFVQS